MYDQDWSLKQKGGWVGLDRTCAMIEDLSADRTIVHNIKSDNCQSFLADFATKYSHFHKWE